MRYERWHDGKGTHHHCHPLYLPLILPSLVSSLTGSVFTPYGSTRGTRVTKEAEGHEADQEWRKDPPLTVSSPYVPLVWLAFTTEGDGRSMRTEPDGCERRGAESGTGPSSLGYFRPPLATARSEGTEDVRCNRATKWPRKRAVREVGGSPSFLYTFRPP